MDILSALHSTLSGPAIRSSVTKISLIALGLLAGCADPPEEADVESAALGIYSPTNQTQGPQSFACDDGAPVKVRGAGGVTLAPGTR